MLRYFRIFTVTGAVSILALAACGGGTGPYGSSNNQQPPPPPPPAPGIVAATPSLTFTPSPLTIDRGEIVTFNFGAVAHNVTFDSPDANTPADIPGVNANVSVQRTFSAPGTYRYHCTIHPGMSGSIVVN
jgi:plastocyanin